MRGKAFLAAVAVIVLPALSAGAQAVDGATARAQLFSPEGTAIAVSGQLTETQRLIVRTMASEAGRTGQDFAYYGAIAFSPNEGLQSESLQGAFNFHGPAAAEQAALSACEAARPRNGDGCVIAGRILPQEWEQRQVTLSQDATAAFEEVYVPAAPPKAFSKSPETGAWAIARGPSAASDAEARCNENAAAKDGPAACRTVIAERK